MWKFKISKRNDEIIKLIKDGTIEVADIVDSGICPTCFDKEIINTNGTGHGLLGELLISKGVNALICGWLGSGARNILEENNIKVYPGVVGNSDKVIEDFINNKLEYDEDKKCDHHEYEHNCENHDCSKDIGGCSENR